jgi:hypothetical protein
MTSLRKKRREYIRFISASENQEEAGEETEHPLQALSAPHEGAFFAESVLAVPAALFSAALLPAPP